MELQEQQECYRLKLSLKVFKVLILERKKKKKGKYFLGLLFLQNKRKRTTQ